MKESPPKHREWHFFFTSQTPSESAGNEADIPIWLLYGQALLPSRCTMCVISSEEVCDGRDPRGESAGQGRGAWLRVAEKTLLRVRKSKTRRGV